MAIEKTGISIWELSKIDLFAGLGDRWLEEIKRISREDVLAPGAVVFTAGSQAEDVYVLLEGKVAIEIDLVVGERRIKSTVHTVRKGEVFAWSALVPPYVLTASARCMERAKVAVIKGRALLDLLEEFPGIGYVVMKNLSGIISSRLASTRMGLQREIHASLLRD